MVDERNDECDYDLWIKCPLSCRKHNAKFQPVCRNTWDNSAGKCMCTKPLLNTEGGSNEDHPYCDYDVVPSEGFGESCVNIEVNSRLALGDYYVITM